MTTDMSLRNLPVGVVLKVRVDGEWQFATRTRNIFNHPGSGRFVSYAHNIETAEVGLCCPEKCRPEFYPPVFHESIEVIEYAYGEIHCDYCGRVCHAVNHPDYRSDGHLAYI